MVRRSLTITALVLLLGPLTRPAGARTYYIDSVNGSDSNSGLTEATAWKTIAPRLQQQSLAPGDQVLLKKGSSFDACYWMESSGNASSPITIGAYGDGPAPVWTNSVWTEESYGDCIRVNADYVTIQNIKFYHTPACPYPPPPYDPVDPEGWGVWEMGAINTYPGADYVTVQYCEFEDCVAGIRSRGQYADIHHNYIHDCDRLMVPTDHNWGPIGIWLGHNHQNVHHNTIINMIAYDPGYNPPIKGGAFEIDDNRVNKDDINLLYNYTRRNCGFLEVTFNCPAAYTSTETSWNWHLCYNVSDDFQAFSKHRHLKDSYIEHNTILLRQENDGDMTKGVFVIKNNNRGNYIRNNAIYCPTRPVFQIVGVASPADHIDGNCYDNGAGGSAIMGGEGPGTNPQYGSCNFVNLSGSNAIPQDFYIQASSRCRNAGVWLGYTSDFEGWPYTDRAPDIGAFEHHPSPVRSPFRPPRRPPF